jgi:hypothetical protein
MAKNNSSFKKGEIHNPRGRPKDGESMTALLNEYLKGTEGKDKKERRQILIEKIYKKAKDGDKGALTYIFDRLDGKPGEHVKLTGDKDEALKIILEDARDKDKTPSASE